MKDGSREDLQAIVENAKKEASEILKEGRIFNYSDLTEIMSNEDSNPKVSGFQNVILLLFILIRIFIY